MFTSGTAPPSGVKLSWAAFTAPVDVPVVERGEEPGGGGAEAHLLALHVRRAAQRLDARVAVELEARREADGGDPEHEHRREDRPALAPVADEAAEREGERERDREQRPDLDQVRERGRVLERVRRVRVRDPAAVRPELLDRLLARDRRRGRSTAPRPRPSCASARPRRLWTTPWLASTSAIDERERQQHARRRSASGRPRSCRSCPSGGATIPRMSATATAMPTAAETKFCTASPAIWVRWLIVDSPP